MVGHRRTPHAPHIPIQINAGHTRQTPSRTGEHSPILLHWVKRHKGRPHPAANVIVLPSKSRSLRLRTPLVGGKQFRVRFVPATAALRDRLRLDDWAAGMLGPGLSRSVPAQREPAHYGHSRLLSDTDPSTGYPREDCAATDRCTIITTAPPADQGRSGKWGGISKREVRIHMRASHKCAWWHRSTDTARETRVSYRRSTALARANDERFYPDRRCARH